MVAIIQRPAWDFSEGMAKTVFELGGDFYYYSVSALANPFGNSQSGLSLYKDWLQSLLTKHNEPAYRLTSLCGNIQRRRSLFAFVLLCGCRDPKKCHRSVLAEVLVEWLGEGWEVVHLE